MSSRALIKGWGMGVPSRILTNTDLEKIVDTSDRWIRERTVIVDRRIVADGETTATLATAAARSELSISEMEPSGVDLIVVATCSPDYQMASTAPRRRPSLSHWQKQSLRIRFLAGIGSCSSLLGVDSHGVRLWWSGSDGEVSSE